MSEQRRRAVSQACAKARAARNQAEDAIAKGGTPDWRTVLRTLTELEREAFYLAMETNKQLRVHELTPVES